MAGDTIKIGEFIITESKIGTFWVGHVSGEGMEVTSKALEEAIAKFYNENF
jgi:hypothetical protein